jgi:methionyl-tRNA formyltransferase
MSVPPPSASSSGPLKIVFMGTPALAAHILDRLVTSGDPRFSVTALVTRPDEPRGRGMTLAPSEVAALAGKHGIAVLKPNRIKTPEFLAELKSFEPDLFVVAAYGRILPDSILSLPSILPVNVHASLLPRHRGAAPIEGAILAGDTETGVTIMRMVSQMDAGPMILQRAIPITPDDTQGSLKEKLAELGAIALLEALNLIWRGEAIETPQDDSAATYTKQISKDDAVIDWNDDAAAIERMTRAFDPWPVARTVLDGDALMIWRAQVVDGPIAEESPGALVELKPAQIVRCGSGALRLLEVQSPGRKRMSAIDYFNGRRIALGTRLGS